MSGIRRRPWGPEVAGNTRGAEHLPPIPLHSWSESKETLHRFLQIVGKIRLAQAPRRNHWWHVPLHLPAAG